jgi:outer membrane lipoprotein-sorting protein
MAPVCLWLGLALLFCSAAPGARADLAMDVARIAVEMAGGEAAHGELRALRATGVTRVGEAEVPFILYTERPDRVRIETVGEKGSLVRAYDGVLAPWKKTDALAGPQRLGAVEQRQFIREAEFDGPLYQAVKRGVSLDYAGRAMVDGVLTHRLLVTMRGGELATLYVDAATYLLVRREVKAGNVTIELRYEDYRPVAGVLLPWRVRAVAGGRVLHETVIEDYVANPELPEGFFSPPAVGWPRP